jgi:nucleotide-binding universal stress UspA family protein
MNEVIHATQTDSESRSNRIVVGHDGSGGAGEALRMALKLADLLQASVLLARAWSMTTAPSLMCHLTTEPSMPARRSPSSSSHATP